VSRSDRAYLGRSDMSDSARGNGASADQWLEIELETKSVGIATNDQIHRGKLRPAGKGVNYGQKYLDEC